MDLSKLTNDDFPLIYSHGHPVAVLVDLEIFQRMVDTLARLRELAQDEEEAAWIMEIVTEARAYRQAHPDEVMTFDSPEAILAALDMPNG
jgi:PHD/YefM family antitoxin component YafN of YafNO toxin-antitoxin module